MTPSNDLGHPWLDRVLATIAAAARVREPVATGPGRWRRDGGPRPRWPAWKRVTFDLLESTGSCTRAELLAEWLRLYDTPAEKAAVDERDALTFGGDTVKISTLDRELNRLRNRLRTR